MALIWDKHFGDTHLVRGEGVHVLQEGLPHLRAALEHTGQLWWRQLEENIVGLRFGALAALHKALPHFRILPHLCNQPAVNQCTGLSAQDYKMIDEYEITGTGQ